MTIEQHIEISTDMSEQSKYKHAKLSCGFPNRILTRPTLMTHVAEGYQFFGYMTFTSAHCAGGLELRTQNILEVIKRLES